jgi:hypothetical protein
MVTMNYTLTLTQHEIQVIANAIVQLPYSQVAALVANMQQQLNAQDAAREAEELDRSREVESPD